MSKSIIIICMLMCGQFLRAEQADVNDETSLDWKPKGIYELATSRTTLTVQDNYMVVFGDSAASLNQKIGNPPNSKLEAILCDQGQTTATYFYYSDDGYVSISDWNSIDTEKFLENLKNDAEELNKSRPSGSPSTHVTGWIQKPMLDEATGTVSYAMEVKVEGYDIPIVNSLIIKLGRKGWETILWSGPKSYYKSSEDFNFVVPAHNLALGYQYEFSAGYRYEDYTVGDRIADVGIATLVQSAASTGKVVAAGIFILVLKKVWALLAVGAVAYLYKIKKFFGFGKKDEDTKNAS